MGQWWPAEGSGELSVAVHAWDLWKEATINFVIFITSGQTMGREHSIPHKEKTGLNVY